MKYTGYIKGTTSDLSSAPAWTDVKLVTCGKMNMAIVKHNNSIEMYGCNKNSHFEGSYDTSNWYVIPSTSDFSATEDNIVDICSGSHFTMFVTEKGQVFATGLFFLTELNCVQGSVQSGKFNKLNLPKESMKALRVWCSRAKNTYMAVVEVQDGEDVCLMSAGIDYTGLLGQGTEDVQCP